LSGAGADDEEDGSGERLAAEFCMIETG
jgi:hypothetical protein